MDILTVLLAVYVMAGVVFYAKTVWDKETMAAIWKGSRMQGWRYVLAVSVCVPGSFIVYLAVWPILAGLIYWLRKMGHPLYQQ